MSLLRVQFNRQRLRHLSGVWQTHRHSAVQELETNALMPITFRQRLGRQISAQ